jgi:glycosyltransferase involved in cell wall biosynthesis
VTEKNLAGESIVCFAGEDWWYHHPHSKNHILKRLARNNKVLFVNSIGMGLPSISNADFFLKVKRKLKSYLRWFRKVPEGLYVLTAVSLPFHGVPWVRVLNRVVLTLQVRFVMVCCGMSKPIVWVAIPFAADVVKGLNPKLILYHVSDKYDANEDSAVSRDLIRHLDIRLKKSADVVLYSGRKLYEESDLPNRYFLEQAVDFEHFSQEAAKPAPDILRIGRPILGYFGWIDYVMDVALIEEVARLRPDWNWVFIGTKSNLFDIHATNVHFLGPKPYNDLPRYLRQIDVCVLPWRRDHEFTNYGSAIKVREYMASGKPVVISPLYEYLKTPGVRIYQSVHEFINAVEESLHNDSPQDRELRRNTVRDCTWDVRARELGALLRSLLDQPVPAHKSLTN